MKNGVYLLLLLLAAGFLIGKFWPQVRQQSNPAPATTTVPSPALGPGRLSLVNKSRGSYHVGEPITLVVTADSGDRKISGYDIVVKYNPELATFMSNKSLQPEFQVFSRPGTGSVTVTAVRQLNNPLVPLKASIAELTFTPKATGTIQFSLDFVPASTADSNLMDDTSKDVLGSVENMSVEVR